MLQNGFAGEAEVESSGGRTVVVGIKLDSPSRELLTWALVKVAQPGDCVIALHVLGKNGKRNFFMGKFFLSYLDFWVFLVIGFNVKTD